MLDELTITTGKLANDSVTVAKIVDGTAYQRLRTTSGGADVEWFDERSAIVFVFDGGGSTMTTGEKGDVWIPFACSVMGWTMVADAAGSVKVELWVSSYAAHPHASADLIFSTDQPLISGVRKNQDTALTSWLTSINAGDVMTFYLSEAVTATHVILTLDIVKQG